MTTKERIKAEIDMVDDEHLDELYTLVRRFAGGLRLGGERGAMAEFRPSNLERPPLPYVGSPRLVHGEQAADFEKEVIGGAQDARL